MFSWGEVEDWGRPASFPKRDWVYRAERTLGEHPVAVTCEVDNEWLNYSWKAHKIFLTYSY